MRLGKAGGRHGNRVSPDRQVRDPVLAGAGGFRVGFDAGGVVPSDDSRIRDGGATGIKHRAREIAAYGLGEADEAGGQGE